MQGRTRRSADVERAPRPAIDLRLAPLTAEPPPTRAASRCKIWEIQGGLQCSIVGTCLSQEDLLGIGRQAGVRPREDARAYEVHSYFVQQVGKDGKIARTVQKLLDQRHAGIIRRVQAAREEAELTRLWDEEFEGGRVAGAYWAFMSTAHVPSPLGIVPGRRACDETVQTSIARRILYVGGRSGAIENLRRVAARMGAELMHHDGGEEHALVRIDGMIEGCDAVVCPIDCVSHSACLRAKVLCRKFAKPFVPLRSAGATSFERAVQSLTARPG